MGHPTVEDISCPNKGHGGHRFLMEPVRYGLVGTGIPDLERYDLRDHHLRLHCFHRSLHRNKGHVRDLSVRTHRFRPPQYWAVLYPCPIGDVEGLVAEIHVRLPLDPHVALDRQFYAQDHGKAHRLPIVEYRGQSGAGPDQCPSDADEPVRLSQGPYSFQFYRTGDERECRAIEGKDQALCQKGRTNCH